MPRNTLVINCDIRETRVALIEGGVIAELQIERATAQSTVGNIVLGRVTRVLPGMQAAFIDVGMERAAFLHVEDLIRPDDLDAYLAGARRHDEEERAKKGDGGKRRAPIPQAIKDEVGEDVEEDEGDEDEDEEPVASVAAAAASVPDAEDADEDDEDDDEEVAAGALDEEDEPGDDAEGDEPGDDAEGDEPEGDDPDEDDEDDEGDEGDDEEDADEGDGNADGPLEEEDAPADSDPEEEEEEEEESDEEDADPAEEDATVVDAEEEGDEAEGEDAGEAGGAPSEGRADSVGSRRRRRRRRRRGRDEAGASSPTAAAPVESERRAPAEPERRAPREPARPAREQARAAREFPRASEGRRANREQRGERAGRNANQKEARNGKDGRRLMKGIPRVSRSVPITEVVKEGDDVIVQISKEPIGTKGARVTSHVSLPGRYVVYLPTVDHVGVSKRIGSARERARLRQVVETMKPPTGGVIVRTVAEGLTKKDLKADIGYLVRLWEDVLKKKREGGKAPTLLYTELDLVLKTARDLFTEDIESIVIDDKAEYARLVRFVEMFMPNRVKDIHYYSGDEPIFDAYGIEDEIARALSRKVPLASGGYLIIDQAEALTAIDVNTGRFVGKGSKDLEETALKTNLEAVDEIAYQLRFRNIGGLVILDLIDMDAPGNREKVWRALEQRLAKDKAKTTINRISELGLIEMTRKRTRESLTRTMHETCFYCDGTGQIQSRTTIAYEILRQIRRERQNLPGYSVVVNAHPAVVDLMTGEERQSVAEAERRYMRRIEFNPRREYHIEQFDLQGK